MPKSFRFSVATHVLTVMAIRDGQPLRSEDIAERAETNPTIIRRILAALNKVGITTAQYGVGGGGLLARTPDQITLRDVYEAVEDTEVFHFPRGPRSVDCPLRSDIEEFLAQRTSTAEAALGKELAKTTIADIATEMQAWSKAGRLPFPLGV